MLPRVSAGVITCNEEQTIGPVLQFLSDARSSHWEIVQIVVVSAECRDRTDAIVQEKAARDPRILLVSEPKRRGKSAAVNTFLDIRSPSEFTLLTSGDVLPAPDFLDKVLRLLDDPTVGMAGGRPMPVNDPSTLLGAMARLMWEMHHEISLDSPKLGETIVFRSAAVSSIPAESPVDEASIEAIILQQHLRLAYAPDAVVHNRGPANLKEWLSQRRRIAYGHAWLKRHSAHQISTGANSTVASLLLKHLTRQPSDIVPGLFLMGCEVWARFLAGFDARSKNQHQIWDIATSTKAGFSK